MDTLFIQFYTRTTYPPMCFQLGNGFSETYDLCKSKGDFYWVEHSHTEILETDLPINKGTVYASCLYLPQLYRCYIWAKRYPNIKFIVGGPGAQTCQVRQELPKNMILTEKSVEEWFKTPNFSYKWKLKVPNAIPDNDTIYFTYTLDNTCYWSKCTFCSYNQSRIVSDKRYRKDTSFDFNVDYNGQKMIRLGTDAMMPKHIMKLNNLPQIDRLNGFRAFLRAGKKELEVLKSCDNLDNVRFNIGLEFPTKRMWDHMQKGYESAVVIDILATIKRKFSIKILFGWNNLIDSDLFELESFMKQIPYGGDDCSLKTGELYAIHGTKIHNTYMKGKELEIGPFYVGFKPQLTKDQIDINKKAHKIVLNYAKEKEYYILDLCNFEGSE